MSLMSAPVTTRPEDLPLDSLYTLLESVTVSATSPRSTFINWGLSYTCRPLSVFEPENEYQCRLILELARREGKTVRAAGVGHSPSDLACTSGYMLRTERLNRIIDGDLRRSGAGSVPISSGTSFAAARSRFLGKVNTDKNYVVAQAGITLHALHAELQAHNLAMINVGSISDQTLGGIVTTATHGSGINFGVISTHVLSLVLILADGSRVRCSRQEHSDLFMASICGLGSTGLIIEVQLEVEPAFRLQETQVSVPFDDAVRDLDEVVNSAEHVRMWWFPQTDVVRVSSADRTTEPRNPVASWLWHSVVGLHVVQFMLYLGRFVTSLNPWTARLGAWLVRDKTVAVDDSYRIFNVDCKYPQFTTEWAIPYDNTQACLRELHAWYQKEHADPNGLRPHFPIEIRFSAADDIWLSPSCGQRTCWIGIIQYKPYGFNVPYRKLFERFENILARHGGRPHWAKAHRLRPADLRVLYPRFDEFIGVLNEIDPRGVFRNEYVQRHIFGKQGAQYDERIFKQLRA